MKIPTIATLFLMLAATTASATSTLVPDDYPTIQQAIDSGADTVVVRDGTYDEDLTAPDDLVLLAYSPGGYSQFNAPVVGGLSAAADIAAEGIRFTGPVVVADAPSFGNFFSRFDACRFDAALGYGERLPSLPLRAWLHVSRRFSCRSPTAPSS